MKKAILFTLIVLIWLKFVNAQQVKADSSFGVNGVVTADYGNGTNNSSTGDKVLAQSDGSVYIFCHAEGGVFISKRNPDWTRDLRYGHNGFAKLLINFSDAILQADGKLLVAGSSSANSNTDFALARYNTDGTLDNTFSEDGVETTNFSSNSNAGSLSIQSDGKIVVGGNAGSDFALARYNIDGSLDKGFSGDGKQITHFDYGSSIRFISIQSDGKIEAAGSVEDGENYAIAIAFYNSDGSLDNNFSNDGKNITNFISDLSFNSMVVQGDGKVMVGGLTGSEPNINFGIARFNIDGSLDKSFSDDGRQTTEFNPRGEPFSPSYVNSLAIQEDGKIVAVGNFGVHSNIAIARYNKDGSPDSSFSDDGRQTLKTNSFDETVASSVFLQSDGKIIVGGTHFDYCKDTEENCPIHFYVARLNADGNNVGEVEDQVFKGLSRYTNIAIQKDGKTVAVGNAIGVSFIMARYNTNGSLDNTFSEDGLQGQTLFTGFTASSIAIQNDGKIVVAGNFALNKKHIAIIRFNTDGSLDKTFNEVGGVEIYLKGNVANALAIQSDGKIVVAGGGIDLVILRYNTNGTIDKTFSGDGIQITDLGTPSDNASSAAIGADGKIIVQARNAIVRYNTDGSLDNSFSEDGMQFTDSLNVFSSAIQSDGKIVAIGYTYHVSTGSYSVLLYRYNIDGSLDNTFSKDGKVTTGYVTNIAGTVAIENGDKIVVGGIAVNANRMIDFSLEKYNIDGSADKNFGQNGKFITGKGLIISAMAITENDLYVAGALGNSAVIAKYLLDNQTSYPTVTLTSNNTTRLAPANIRLVADAKDADGTISKVEFYNGSHLLHTEYVTPYGFKWKNVPVGNYTLTAKAYDNSGLITTSAPIHISVVPNKPPIVSIIKPVIRQTVAAPGYIHLEAEAKDEDGRIARVEFYNGSTLIRTEYYPPYTYHWENVPRGIYTITAVAVDNWAARTTSAPVTIRVVNPPVGTANKPSAENNRIDVNNAISLNLAPNPANDIITITAAGLQQNKQLTLQVISSGAVLKTIQSNSSAKTIQLDVSNLISGVYVIKVTCGDKVLYKQFAKL